MAQEIERKFLVKGSGWKKLTLLKKVKIQQGYLSKGRMCNVRIRVADESACITIKSKRVNLTCQEYEYEIPRADAVEMLSMSMTPLIEKTRYYVRDDKGQVWDIDVFEGVNKGLTMAEIEMKDAKQSVVIPSWIGAEVSHDKRYNNIYIAEHAVPHTL